MTWAYVTMTNGDTFRVNDTRGPAGVMERLQLGGWVSFELRDGGAVWISASKVSSIS